MDVPELFIAHVETCKLVFVCTVDILCYTRDISLRSIFFYIAFYICKNFGAKCEDGGLLDYSAV